MKIIYSFFIALLLCACQTESEKHQKAECKQLDQFPSKITTLIGRLTIKQDTFILDRIKDISTSPSSVKSTELVPCEVVKKAILQNKDYKLKFEDTLMNGLWVHITGKWIDTLKNINSPQLLTNSVIFLNPEDFDNYYFDPLNTKSKD